MSDRNQTAANIISSLGVKGATASGGTSASAGFVPVLGADGKLSVNFIPSEAVRMTFPPLSNVFCVDPYTTAENRNGSVAAPFVSLTEAAQAFEATEDAWASKSVAFLLMPGKYEDNDMTFSAGRMPLGVYLLGVGACTLAKNPFVIGGLATEAGRRTTVVIQNVSSDGRITVSADADVTVLGNSRIVDLMSSEGTSLFLSAESRVDSTNIETVSYLTEDSAVGNTSEVNGRTVRDALSRLNRRRIRMARISADSSKLHVDSSSFYEISTDSSGSEEFFDMIPRDRLFVDAINSLFRNGDDIVARTVTAEKVVAEVVEVGEFRMDAMTLGGYKMTVDAYGYLVVVDGSEDPPRPPDKIFRLMDSVTGAIYIVGVANGRMYLAEDDLGSSSDSSSAGVPTEFTVYDPKSGYTYSVSLENGRMIITRIGG